YKVTDANGCSSNKQTAINVIAAPTVSLDPIQSVCQNASSFSMTGGQPTGGTYFVNEKEVKIFVPSAYNPGTYSVSYIYSNGSGCQGVASRTITVFSAPTVSLSDFTPVCENGESVALSSGMPTGGTYINDFVAGGKFYPDKSGAGTQTIVYSYTNANGCTSTVNKSIEVKPITALTLPVFQPICKNNNSFIVSGAVPAGGTYYVDGVESSIFVPANYISGYHTIKYNYKNQNGCISTTNAQIQVFPVPAVELPAFDDVCQNANDIKLKSGYPAGGTYYVEGVKSTVLIPSDYESGNYQISYQGTNDYGCSASVSRDLRILASPEVTLPTFKKLCENSGDLPLSGASPAGGSWNGDGVIDQVFRNTIGEGKYTATYTYTGENGCSNSKSTQIEVLSAQTVSLANFSPVCQNASSFSMTGGLPIGGSYMIDGIATQQFNPLAFEAGNYQVKYQLINEAGCISAVVKPITVLSKTEVTIFDEFGTCPNASSFTLTGGLPTGGDYYINNKKVTEFNLANYAIGAYPVTYTFTNSFGCSDSDASIISVFDACPNPELKTEAVYCPNEDISLSLLNLNSNLKVDWYTSDGDSNTKLEVASNESEVVLKSDKSFSSIVQYTDLNGCKSEKKEVYVNVESLTTNITTSTNQVKQGDLLKLSSNVDKPNLVNAYLWEFSDGTVSNEKDAWKYFNILGDIDVKIYVETLNGCQFSQTAKNFVTVSTVANTTESESGSGSDINGGPDESFNQLPNILDITMFPNPTVCVVNLTSNTDNTLTYKLFSQNGDVLIQGEFKRTTSIQLRGASGIYLVQILDSGRLVKTERIIKQ
ncbi:MAG: T9SS type A sorting domain-containing protein, partial [Peptostreptococcaceae bacterium]|nr:T9SS type A sorting domain-containing protein [Peptostreptococcaceae bacterium]